MKTLNFIAVKIVNLQYFNYFVLLEWKYIKLGCGCLCANEKHPNSGHQSAGTLLQGIVDNLVNWQGKYKGIPER